MGNDTTDKNLLNLLTKKTPPANRVGTHTGLHELHMYEPSVMLAAAEWLLANGAREVKIHPDGMHLKQIDIPAWLCSRGFERVTVTGRSKSTGDFVRGEQRLRVHSQPGLGDVVAEIDGKDIEFEAKGGCINSRHSGQLSKLRKGLHEAVGQLMSSPRDNASLIAIVPMHDETLRLAKRLAPRCNRAGVEIALAKHDGALVFVRH